MLKRRQRLRLHWYDVLTTLDSAFDERFNRIPDDERESLLDWVGQQLESGRYERVYGLMGICHDIVNKAGESAKEVKDSFPENHTLDGEQLFSDYFLTPEYRHMTGLDDYFSAVLSMVRSSAVSHFMMADAKHGLTRPVPFTGGLTPAQLEYLAAFKALAKPSLAFILYRGIFLDFGGGVDQLRDATNDLVRRLGIRRNVTALSERIAERAGITPGSSAPREAVRQALFYRVNEDSIIRVLSTDDTFLNHVGGLFYAITRLDQLRPGWENEVARQEE